MDSIEREGLGQATAADRPDRIAPASLGSTNENAAYNASAMTVDPVSGIAYDPNTGQPHSPNANTASAPEPEETFAEKPQVEDEKLQSAYKNMQAAFTRKTQELAQLRRDAELARQQALSIAQQYAPREPQTPKDESLVSKLPAHLKEKYDSDPDFRFALGSVEAMASIVAEDKINRALKERTAPIESQLQELQSHLRTKDLEAQTRDLVSKYGQATLAPYAEQIVGAVQSNRNMTMEQALMYVAPNVVQERIFEDAKKAALEELKKQDNSSQAKQASVLQGGKGAADRAVSGYRPGESARDTALRRFPELKNLPAE